MTRCTHRRNRIVSTAVLAAAIVTTAAGTASATNYTWTATAGGIFAANANWTPAGSPANATDAAFFNSASTYPITFAANATTGSLAASAGSVTLLSSGGQKTWTLTTASVSGGSLTLGTAGNPMSFNALILNLTGAASLNAKFTSDIIATSVNVGTSTSAATSTFTIDGGGSNLTASGGIAVGASGGHGSVVLQNNAAAVVGGTGVTIGDATSPGEFRILSGSSLTTPSIAAGVGATNLGSAYLLVDTSATLTINGAGTITAGANTGGGTTTLAVSSDGTLNTGSGATLIDQTGILKADAGSTVNVNGGLTVKGAATFNPGTLHLATGKSLSASSGGNVTFYNGFTTPSGSAFHVDGATLTTRELNPGDGADFSLGAGATLDVTNAGTFTPLRLNLGNGVANASVTVDGAGSSLSAAAGPNYVGANNGSGTLAVRHGASATFVDAFYVGSGGSTSSGTLTLDTGGSVTVKDLFVGDTALTSCTGAISLSDLGSTLTVQHDLNVGGASSASTVTVSSGASLVHGAGTTPTPVPARIGTGGGTARFRSGSSLHITGGDVAFGAINADPKTIQLDSGTLGFDGSLTVGPTGPMGGVVTLNTGAALAMTGSLTLGPSSTLSLAGGALATSSITNNSGTFNYSYGTLAITGPAGFTVGPGTPLGNAPTLVAGQTLLVTADTAVNAGATFNLFGSTFTTGTLTNNGLLTVGNFSNATVNNGFTNAPAGRLFIESDLTLTANGPSSNAGRVTLQGGSARLLGTAALTNTGLITGDGELAKDLSNAATGELRADAGQNLLLSGPSATANAGKINLQGGTIEFSAPLANNAGGVVSGRGTLIANAGIANAGQMSFSAGITDVRGPVTNSNKILVTGASTTTFYDPFVNTAGASVFTAAGSSVVFLSSVSGTGAYTGAGAKYFSDGSSTTGPLEPGGVTVVDEPASLSTPDLIEQGVTVNGRISIPTAAHGGKTSKINALSIGPGGSFDLSDTRLVLDYAAGTTAPTDLVRQYLLANQLTSSTAAADPQHRLAIGYADNTLLNAGAWGGLSVDPTSVLTRLTYFGDANLDGQITPDDYALLDRSLAKHLPDAHWTDGDFNYDGTIDQNDYLLIDTTLAQSQGLSPAFLAQRESQFGPAYVSQLLASVPEPASPLACLFAGSLFARRRRVKPAKR